MKKIITLTYLILLSIQFVFAQAPSSFRYQAVIRNADGEIYSNKSLKLRISILEDTPVGDVVFSQIFDDIETNQFGIVSVSIGTGDNLNNLNWGANSYYLQVEVDIDDAGYELMGAAQILAVPYALYAVDVKNNDDADADPTNEIQDLHLDLATNILTITGKDNPVEIGLSQYLGVDTDDQTLSISPTGNNISIAIEDGNSINFDLPSDFVKQSTGGTFSGAIHAPNFTGNGNLLLSGDFSLSGTSPVELISEGTTTLTLPISGRLATEGFVASSVASSNNLSQGSIWIGNAVNIATPFSISTNGAILIGNGATAGSYPITGDATMSSSGVLTLANTVTPGTYFNTTVDAKGRVISGSNPITLAGFGITDALSNSLSSGNIYVGNLANIASQVSLSGDASLSSSGVLTLTNTSVTPGTYFRTTVDSKGRVVFGDNPTTLAGFGITDALSTILNNGNILIGNGSNIASQVVMSGDATLSSLGVLTLVNTPVVAGTYQSVIVDSKGRVTGGTNPTTIGGYGITDALSNNLTDGYVYIGNASNTAVGRVISGDATISNAGVVTVSRIGSHSVSLAGTFTTQTSNIILRGYNSVAGSDVSLPQSGTLATEAYVNTQIAAGYELTQGYIFVGNSDNDAVRVDLHGDADLTSDGTLTLSNSGVTASTYRSVTVDSKGRVTAGTNPTSLSGYGITDAVSNTLTSGNLLVGSTSNIATGVALSGDASLASDGTLTLSNSGVTASTYRSVTVDSKGRVTAGTNPTSLSGYGITDAVSNSLTSGYLFIGNSSSIATGVELTGDASIASDGYLTLSNSGVTASTYRSVTVDSKGRVTAGTNPTSLSGYGITDAVSNSLASGYLFVGNSSSIATGVELTGDASIASDGTLTLTNSGVTAGTYTSVTVDGKGRVTAGTNPADVTFTTVNITSVLSLTPLSAEPSTAQEGDLYVNSTTHTLHCYLDGVWVQLN